MNPMRAMLAVWCAVFVGLAPATVRASESASVAAVLSALAASPEQPVGYKASVALHVRLRVFPFIHLTLHGDSWYKRPGLYRFVFRGVPLVAKAFSDSKYDLGDPAHWSERYEVAFAPDSTTAAPVLRLTPKTPVLVKTLDVSVDPGRGRILKAVWTRSDGGVITLVQTYAPVAGHQFIARQTATINLPRMKADVEAEYANFDLAEASVATTP